MSTGDRAECAAVSRLETIAAIDGPVRVCEDSDAEAPIFLLSTGWRSGSTLLQRILVTDPNVLLWGEPLGEMALLPGIAGMLTGLETCPGLKELCAADNPAFSSLPTSWIATLYPPGGNFRDGLQTLLTRWLGEPARRRGFGRWGFKEVRLGGTEAMLLRWLYPRAKFVLLCRNPYDCYLSLADSGWLYRPPEPAGALSALDYLPRSYCWHARTWLFKTAVKTNSCA
jgi:Sulfotransferase family